MVVNINSSIYKFSCTNCDWTKEILIKKFPYSLITGGCKTPRRCPQCGSKLKREKLHVKF